MLVDIAAVIVLFVLLYVVPEILRHMKPKRYEYPQIPEQPAPEMQPEPADFPEYPSWTGSIAKTQAASPGAVTMPPPVKIGEVAHSDQSAWTGQLTVPMLINGFIFATILEPPRALRPYGYRLRLQKRS